MKPSLTALLLIPILACQGVIDTEPRVSPDVLPPDVVTAEATPDVGWAPSALLTTSQYQHVVLDLFGESVSEQLPAENRTDLFVNNAFSHEATLLSEELRANGAQVLAETLPLEQLEASVGCGVNCDGDQLIHFLRRAFRRTLPIDEQQTFIDLVLTAPDYEDGLRLLTEVILLSPQFLYRFEAPQMAPNPEGTSEADGFTLASRLSFFLWDSAPDDTLLELAESGALLDVDVIASEVLRLMADPRFERSIASFHAQWLELEDVDGLSKSGEGLSEFADMGAAWRESLDAFIVDAFDEGLTGLLTSPNLTLNAELAAHYGFDPTGPMARYAFDPSERAGLLTHPALLAKLAYSDQDSPIARGVFVMRRFLCREPPPPPADVDITPPVVDPDSTSRERFSALTGVQPCIGCHQQFNPIGFLFGAYDAAGQYRTTSTTGRTLDTAATLNRFGDIGGEYGDATEFARALAESDDVRDCVAGHWLRFALGRPVTEQDARSAYEANTAFRESSGDFRTLMQAIATGPAFRLYRSENERNEP